MSGSKLAGAVASPLRAARRRARAARVWARRARLDLRDVRSGQRDRLLPPRRLGLPSNLPAVGESLATLLVTDGRLRRDGAVLDIGCGPGRVAAPLTRRLGPEARYEGFDVMAPSIRWCRRAISRRHPNFNFQLADLRNGQYNPDGAETAAEYTFPYADAAFDAALAGSLFTHMRPYESARYLSQAARVLREGGRLLSTWFLFNEAVEARLAAGELRRPGVLSSTPLRLDRVLTDERGYPYRALREDVPEFMIVVDQELVVELHRRAGLRVLEIRAGSWTGPEQGSAGSGQDMVISEARA